MLQFWAGNSLVDTTSHNLMEVGEIFRLKGHAISSGGEALLIFYLGLLGVKTQTSMTLGMTRKQTVFDL